MILTQVSSGSGSIMSLDDAKAHLRVNIDDDDDYITSLIAVAQEYVQQETGLRFYADVYNQADYTFPYNPQVINLMRYPVTSVTYIEYYDNTNTLQTLDPSKYYVELPTDAQAFITPVWQATVGFPATFWRPDSVQVTYVTGITPNPLAVHAAKLLIGGFYVQRESEITMMPKELVFGVQKLLRMIDRRRYA